MPLDAADSKSLLTSHPFAVASLGIAFLLVAAASLLGNHATRGIAATHARVVQGQQVLLELAQLSAAVSDAESSQRGYLLTGEERDLAPYREAAGRLQNGLQQLRRALASEPGQSATLARLQSIIDVKFAELGATVVLRREQGVEAALDLVETGAGDRSRESLRSLLRAMEAREMAVVAEESAAAAQRAETFETISLGFLGAAIGLAAIAYGVLARRMRELETAITVCAWTKRVKFQGRWVGFEEFLHKRFRLRFTHAISEEGLQQLQREVKGAPRSPPPAHRLVRRSAVTPGSDAGT